MGFVRLVRDWLAKRKKDREWASVRLYIDDFVKTSDEDALSNIQSYLHPAHSHHLMPTTWGEYDRPYRITYKKNILGEFTREEVYKLGFWDEFLSEYTYINKRVLYKVELNLRQGRNVADYLTSNSVLVRRYAEIRFRELRREA